MDNDISHISDTALWIAGYRAQETERPDAVFKDVLAKKLAGDRGMEMVRTTPNTEAMAFAMVVRTVAIDRLVEEAIHYGVDTVINLGAGLDTRPYRMKLPAQLSWIEVDFPGMINYKNEQLKFEKPVCQLQRIACDLSGETGRRKLFSELSSKTKNALIITEGVIGYLTDQQAASLSADLFAMPSFQYWIQDYSQGKFRKNRQTKMLKKKLKNTPLKFQSADPIKFFGKQGWIVKENIFILDEADRIGRRLPLMFPWSLLMFLFRRKLREMGNKTYGYVMFGRP
jgi:methyltransferase (TIGR00027 family)